MANVRKLVVKDDGKEYEIYIAATESVEVPEDEPGYRAVDLPIVDMQKVHTTIQGYAKYAIGAFHNFGMAEVEKITLKFNLKIVGKAGIPLLTEGSAESNFEIQVECKFPQQKNSGS
jgi:Trypsin-co-occurring domain 1